MKLCMRQNPISIKDHFIVYDDDSKARYNVESEIISLVRKLHIYDMSHNELIRLQKKIAAANPGYYIYCNGNQIAEVVKEDGFFSSKYKINGLKWDIKGDPFNHIYKIFDGKDIVASIRKRWLSSGTVYEFEILSDEDQLYALAVIIAIDCILADVEPIRVR